MSLADAHAKRAKSLELTQAEQAWLQEHPRIQLAGDPVWLPMEAFDEHGEYIGIVADHLRLLEDRLGLMIEVVRTTTWTESMDLARARGVDVLSAMPNADRRTFLNFTKPYMGLPVVFVTRRDAPRATEPSQLAGKRVAIPKGYAYVGAVEARFHKTNFIYVETVP